MSAAATAGGRPPSERIVPAVVALLALPPLVQVLRGAVNAPTAFVRNVVEGVSLGGVYALIALGYTMVYGVLGLINFAHSDVFMIGAYVGIFTASWFGVTATSHGGSSVGIALACFAVAMAATAALGMTIERLAYRPVRHAPKLTPLVTAIGVSMFIQNAAMLLFTSRPRGFPPVVRSATVSLGPVSVTNIKLLNLGAALALMVGLTFLVQKTRVGKAMRAISTNLDAARLMGVPTDRIIAVTFGLGSALAGGGGILFGLDQPKIDPFTGVQPGLKAFVAAVLGGIGNIPGAALGGLLLGTVETFVNGSQWSTYKDAIAFAILIIILLFRPAGLLGKFTVEKV